MKLARARLVALYVAPALANTAFRSIRNGVRSVFWGNWNPTTIAANAQGTLPVPTQESLDNQAKKQAERAIEEAGIGTCAYCDEEIMKNSLQIWESEFLLGYCSGIRDGKHKPLVRYAPSEGVVNAQRNSATHSQPVSEERSGG